MQRVPTRTANGVALLTALILLALLTAVAVALSADTGIVIRRQQAASTQDQVWQLVGATEALAGWALREEFSEPPSRVHQGQRWAQTPGPLLPLPGYLLEVQLEDLQGRFNLNSLVDRDGRADPDAMAFFEQLLAVVGLEREWAARLADWLDSDDQPLPGGGEEAWHNGASPAARPANQLMTSSSELLALPGFGMTRYLALAPHVTALPQNATLNLCTATAAVLDSLTGDQQWTLQPEVLRRSQETQCFPGRDAVRNAIRDPQRYAKLERSIGLGEQSRYFGLETWVTTGSLDYGLYSVLHLELGQSSGASVQVLTRETIQ